MNAGVTFYKSEDYQQNLHIFEGLPVEIVTSAYLVNDDKVCLINHKDLQLWLPPGGHLLAEANPGEVVCVEGSPKAVYKETLHQAILREVREETGWEACIADGKLLYSEPGRVHQVPGPRFIQYEIIEEASRPKHVHVNLAYFCKPVRYLGAPSGEEGETEWFTLHQLDDLENTFPHTKMNGIRAILELGSIVPDILKVENGRVLVPIGGRCAYKCKYCYTKRHDVYFGEPDPARTAALVKKICQDYAPETITAQLGYDNDPFENPGLGLDIITRLAWFPVHIGFSTKAYISKDTAGALAILRRIKNENGFNLSALVTLTSLKSATVIEPCAPSPKQRLETVRNLTEMGIPTLINLRPLLPDDVALEELVDLIAMAKEAGALGVVIGAFWADPQGVVLRGLTQPSSVGEKKQAPWSPHGLEWFRYEDISVVRKIKQVCADVGLKTFMSSADAVVFLNSLK